MDTNKRILVVEDDQIQRMICVSQLKQLGFEEISIAKDGNHAYSILEKDKFDLIISDWKMPEMDGLELLKKVKENPSLQDIPFIIFTVHNDENIINEAMELGANDYIIKPGNPEIFKEKLEKFM